MKCEIAGKLQFNANQSVFGDSKKKFQLKMLISLLMMRFLQDIPAIKKKEPVSIKMNTLINDFEHKI